MNSTGKKILEGWMLELVGLRDKNAELERFIAENTPILSYIAIECTTNLDEFKSWLAMRDLEQQVEALHWILSSDSGIELSGSACQKLFERMAQLRNQAKQLKG